MNREMRNVRIIKADFSLIGKKCTQFSLTNISKIIYRAEKGKLSLNNTEEWIKLNQVLLIKTLQIPMYLKMSKRFTSIKNMKVKFWTL